MLVAVLFVSESVRSQDDDPKASQSQQVSADTPNLASRIQKASSLLRTDVKAAAELAEQILVESKQIPPPMESMARWVAAAALVRLEQYASAMVHLEKGVEVARELEDAGQLRRLLRYVAAASYELGDFQRGRDAGREALVITEQIPEARKDSYYALILNDVGGCEAKLGNVEAAAEAFAEALQIAKAEDNHHLEAMLLVNLTDIYSRLNRLDQAEEISRDALARSIEHSSPQMIAAAKLNLGTILVDRGKLQEARQCFTEVKQLSDEGPLQSVVLSAIGHLGQMDETAGNLTAAKENYSQAHALAASVGDLKSQSDFSFRIQRVSGLVDERQDLQRTLALREQAMLSGEVGAWEIHTEKAIEAFREGGDFQQVSALLKELRAHDQRQWDQATADAIAVLEQQVGVLKGERDGSELRHQQTVFEMQREEAEARFHWLMLLAISFGIGLLVTGVMLVKLRRSLFREREAIAKIRHHEQQQVALELKMMDEEKVSSLQVLASGIVHDFNNLLAVITTSADCGSVSQTEVDRLANLDQIAEAAEHASQLTNQLVQYLGGHPSHDRAAELGPVTVQMQPLLESVVKGRADLKILDATAKGLVGIDDSEARQILVNLVSNAAESMRRRGLITIQISRISVTASGAKLLKNLAPGSHWIEQLNPGDYCQLSVTDNGSGMEEATLKRVFDPYFSTKKTGHGLGMASVHGIVRGQDGCVAVRSERHVGTTVDVFLPIVSEGPAVTDDVKESLQSDPQEKRTVPASSSDGSVLPNSQVVLVVDDDPMVSGMIHRVLKREGYTVHISDNAKSARAKFLAATTNYDCVIADFSMPGEDGLSLLTWIRSRYPDVRTVLCSGYHEQSSHYDASVDLCIQKPFRSMALLAAVRQSDSLI